MARNSTNREISIYVNDRQVVNSLAGITRAVSQTNASIRNLNRGSADYEQELERLQGTLTELTERQTQFREEIAETSGASDTARDALGNIFTGLSTGNMQMAQAGIMGIRGAIVSTMKAGLAFIATPIGATIAVLAGIGLATKAWFDYNVEASKTNKIIQGITRESGAALDEIRIRTTALNETFGQSTEETLEAAKVLVNEYGLTYQEALDEIEAGLIRGGSANKEYLESMSEYATFFASAGYSVEEFRNVVQAGYDLGIYTDKLPDAVKEFTLSITEQTKASKEALQNAFGSEFTDKLLKGVKDGSVTAKEALEQISKEAERIGLNSQQAQQLTADLFRGAGEDAGGALKIFDAVNKSYADQNRELTSLEKITQEVLEANKELAEAQDDLLKSDGFAEWSAGFDLAWTKIKTGFYDAISFMVNSKEEIERLASDRAESNNLKSQKELYEKDAEEYLKRRKQRLGAAFDLEKETNDRIKRIQDWMEKPETSAETKKQYQWQIDSIKKVTDSRIAAFNVSKKASLDELADAKKAADEKAKIAKKAADDKKKADEEARKSEEDRQKALIQAQVRLAKAQLDYFVANNVSKIQDEIALTQELIAEETRRLEIIKDKKLDALNEERLRKIEDAEKSKLSDEQLRLEKEAADLEYLTAEQNMQLEFQASTDALKKEFDAQKEEERLAQLALDAEQLALDNELELALAQSKSEEEAIKQKQQYDADLARYQKLLSDKKITDVEYATFKDALDKKQAQIKREREMQDLQTSLGALNSLAGALGELFGQSKELAITQAIINGALGVTSVLSAASMGNPILDAVVKAVQIAAVVSTTAANISKIKSQKPPKQAKFFYGGHTGTAPALGYDEFGAVTGVVHPNEWVAPEVMTASPKYAATFGWLENERKKIMSNGFVDGGATSPNAVPTIPLDSDNSDSNLLSAINRLNNLLSSGIIAKVLFGYAEAEEVEKLNKERNQSSLNGVI